jgi:hypothetical protein
MSQTIFPTLITSSFIPQLWTFSTGFTREYADLHYVKFPIAQGSQSFPLNLSVTGTTTLGETNLQTKNTTQNLTHYLNFSDSSSTGVGQIQKSANFSVNPSTGIFTTSGLTMSGANNITLGDGTVAPTAGGTQLGSVYSGSYSPTVSTFTNATNNTYSTLTLPAGTYSICACGQFNTSGSTTYSCIQGAIFNSTSSINLANQQLQTSGGIVCSSSFGNNTVCLSAIHQSTAAATITLYIYLVFTGVAPTATASSFQFKAVKIA